MTVQQHAPRLEHVRPPLTISTTTLVAAGLIIVVVLAVVAAWLLLQPAPNVNFTIQDEMFQNLRESFGGFI